MVINKISFIHQFGFPGNFYQSVPNTNSKQHVLMMDWDKGNPLNTNFLIILEICQKQPFDIIAMTPRGTLGLCYVHIAQLMTHPAIYTLPFTLQLCYKPHGILQRVTKSQKVHISSQDELQKFHNINFAWNRSRYSQREDRETGISSFPSYFFFKTIQNPFAGIWESIYHIKWGAGWKLGFSYRDTFSTFPW